MLNIIQRIYLITFKLNFQFYFLGGLLSLHFFFLLCGAVARWWNVGWEGAGGGVGDGFASGLLVLLSTTVQVRSKR